MLCMGICIECFYGLLVAKKKILFLVLHIGIVGFVKSILDFCGG